MRSMVTNTAATASKATGKMIFKPVTDTYTRRGFHNDAENAAARANELTAKTGRQHMVSSEMGTLCPKCATSWIDSDERLTLTVETGHLDSCYNCNDN